MIILCGSASQAMNQSIRPYSNLLCCLIDGLSGTGIKPLRSGRSWLGENWLKWETNQLVYIHNASQLAKNNQEVNINQENISNSIYTYPKYDTAEVSIKVVYITGSGSFVGFKKHFKSKIDTFSEYSCSKTQR